MTNNIEQWEQEGKQDLYWIAVDYIRQSGREHLVLRPKAITESYVFLPDGKLQHLIQVCDWGQITPEALWIGTYTQAMKVVAAYKQYVEIEYRILAVPPCLLKCKNGKMQLNNTNGRDFMSELITQEPQKLITTKGKEEDTLTKDDLENFGEVNNKIIEKSNNKSDSTIITQNSLSTFLLNRELTKKIISTKENKKNYINIFYHREPENPPLMENVLDYQAIFARFTPKLPTGWRYMCKLSTYGEQLYKRIKNIATKGWGMTWSEKIIDDVLDDSYLFTEITIEVINNIIFESELMGNELNVSETAAYSK